MRLIDATALKESMEEHVTSMSVCLNMSEHYGMVIMKEQCIEDVNAAPTIDAIPVDWLVQMRDLRRAAVAAHPDISEGSMAVLRGINFVLELWEDEKEAR